MRIFLSYARDDRAAVEALAADLRHMDYEPVFDEQLAAGQAWWDQLLNRIENCEVFVPVISTRYRDSNPCALEAKYAHGLNKAFLPVRIDTVTPSVLPPYIAEAQWVNYDSADRSSVFELVRAFRDVPPPEPPPETMPPRPPVPISYLLAFSEQIDQLDDLTRAQQTMLVSDLGARLHSSDGPAVRELLEKFAQRHDLMVSVANEVNRLLGSETATPADAHEEPAPEPAHEPPTKPSWEPPPRPPTHSSPATSDGNDGRRGGKNKPLIALGAIAGVLVVIGLTVGIIVVGLNSSKDTSNHDTSPISTPVTDPPAPSDTSATLSPDLAVKPSTGLTDGDPVMVTGSGLEADTGYDIMECAQTSTGWDCDTDARVRVTSNSNGTFSDLFDVEATLGSSYDCTSVETQCAIAIATPGSETVDAHEDIDIS